MHGQFCGVDLLLVHHRRVLLTTRRLLAFKDGELSRVFASQAPDLLLMLVVAAAMVAHTLRYRSQVVTGLAFLLAFSTLTISQVGL